MEAPSDTGASTKTLMEVFEAWENDGDRLSKTVDDYRSKLKRFVELHGDLPITAITKAHIREFKDAILRLPKNPGKRREGLKLKDLLAITEKNPSLPRITVRTLNEKYLAALNAVLAWAARNGFIETNPASGMRASDRASKGAADSRTRFDLVELKAIFSSPLFTTNQRPKAGAGEAAKWLPLLALFTGARLEELGQIHVTDIKEQDGISYIDAETLDESRRVKTSSSRRRIPIHKELIRLGFLDYVESMRKRGEKQLFPLLKFKDGKYTNNWSKWWSRYLRQQIGITNPQLVFHSFRHSAKFGFREAAVEEGLMDALQGHAPRTEGGKYGGGYPLRRLKEAIDRLQYPGLNLDHLLLP